jgi:hypothetical protein
MMWMDSYLQETLIRDQIADARRQAARRYLLHCLKASRPRRRYRAVVQELIEAVSVSGRRIASRVLRARLVHQGGPTIVAPSSSQRQTRSP